MSLSEFYIILYSFFDKTVPVKHKAEFKFPHWFSLDLIRKIRLKIGCMGVEVIPLNLNNWDGLLSIRLDRNFRHI